jgi:hypothetical protein
MNSQPHRSVNVSALRKGARFVVRSGAWILVGLILLACAGNITAGGFGEVQVTVSGDADDGPSSVATAQDPRPGRMAASIALHDDDDEPRGKLEIEFLASLIRSDGEVIPVDDKEIEVELDLAGFFEADAVRATLPAGQYVALQIEFTEIEVEVERGVIIDGVEITGPIEVELEDDESITVQRDLDALLRDGGRIDILLDMNARTWLRAMDPDLKKVAQQVFAEAISVEVR